jgi:small subunit ribosomal protein S17
MAEEVENTELEETASADASAEAAASDASAQASTQAAADDAGTDSDTEEAVEAVEVAPAPEPAVEKAAPVAQLTPKERKVAIKTKKAAKVGQRGQVSPEERQAERDAARAKKAAARRIERAHAREKHKAGAHERTATPPREYETITVRIDVTRRHRRYSKIVRSSSTVHAHDESNDANIGDTVVVREARPLSRTKRWRLVQVVERAK